jgi:predicted NBD/HSP70 family sugar kinase
LNLLVGCGTVKGVTNPGPVRQASLRAHNLAIVLRHVAHSPRPPSRAAVATATGLTRATVSTLVDELIGGRLLTEVDPAPRAGAGRPAAGLRLSRDGPAGLGLEVNVDYLATCVVDLAGEVRHHAVSPGDQRRRPPAAVLGEVATLAATAVRAASAAGLTVAGAALAVPGLVAEDAVVRLAPNLGWRDVEVRSALLSRRPLRGLPLSVENEANLAALGELHAAGGAGSPNFVYISGEIGVGAGIVVDGRLFRGARGWSGELGHTTIDPDGPRCRCGSRGCLEQYANQEAIARAAGLATGTAAGEEVASALAMRATAGEPATLRALREAGAALGLAAAAVVNLLDVDTVVLGGIYAPLEPWLREPVTRELAERVVTAGWAPVTVRRSALGTRATVVGAAGSVVRALRDAPASWLAAGQ